MNRAISVLLYLLLLTSTPSLATQEKPAVATTEIFETTFSSKKTYADPFNDVDVDVIFSNNGKTWRVPTFWRGNNRWGVRFAPPSAGEYSYRLESTDISNADLNGDRGRVTIAAYRGGNALLKRGPLKVSANKRYLEHTDGTPFYWLGDGLYTALSDRISWNGFKKLISDRKAKGFTVAEVTAGLTVSNEERAPIDPGFRNEGGPSWDEQFERINPGYFDYADRRIQYLVDSELVPAIIGAWSREIHAMGVAKMQRHWRYLIARYGAYPVVWILGGEVVDPPPYRLPKGRNPYASAGQWTQVARYIRASDPYGHLLTAHEQMLPPYDIALQDESLTDFDLMQPSHFGSASIDLEIAKLNTRWSGTNVTKPIVVGEIGYEGIGGIHLQDFQRTAFWLAMLNGAAGYSYGTTETAMVTSADKPLHRVRYSFYTWEEAMHFPGSYQVGLGANLLRTYPWWKIAPHPEWITPRGTTLLASHDGRYDVDLGQTDEIFDDLVESVAPLDGLDYPKGEWKKKGGNHLLPYAAGIPRQLRIVYVPYFGLLNFTLTQPPTVLGLEDGVRYHAYYWEPSLGIKFDLGSVEKPLPGKLIREDKFTPDSKDSWISTAQVSPRFHDRLTVNGRSILLLKDVDGTDFVAAVDVCSDADAALLLHYQDDGNYLAAVYSSREKAVYLAERKNGRDGPARSHTPVDVDATSATIRLMAEVRDNTAAAAVLDGNKIYSTAIENVASPVRGAVGLMHQEAATTQSFVDFELRASPTVVKDEHLDRKLYDARGIYRGEMVGSVYPGVAPTERSLGWNNFGKRKRILLGAYRPDWLPGAGDWVLVLENRELLGKD